MGNITFLSANSQARKVRILEVLRAAPQGLSCPDLADLVFMSHRNARLYLRSMEKDGQVFITRWDTASGTTAAYWSAGSNESVPKPPKQTPSEVGVRYRAKLRADPDAFDRHVSKDRIRKKIKAMITGPRKMQLYDFIVPRRETEEV